MTVSRRERRVLERDSREELVAKQRAQFKARERNKRIINYTIAAVALIAIGYAIFYFTRPEGPGEFDALAQCLTQKGAIMYGTDWCPHCQEQKRLFGNSFRYVSYTNCDLNPDACKLAGVEGYPTWVFAQGESASGVQQLSTLAERTGCTE